MDVYRTVGITHTSSPPSPLWSGTATVHSPRCPPALCRCLLSSNQVRRLKPPAPLLSCSDGVNSVFCVGVIPAGGSATSSPAMLGIRRHSSNYQRAQSMQLDSYYGDNSLHKQHYTGKRSAHKPAPHWCVSSVKRNEESQIRLMYCSTEGLNTGVC